MGCVFVGVAFWVGVLRVAMVASKTAYVFSSRGLHVKIAVPAVPTCPRVSTFVCLSENCSVHIEVGLGVRLD